MIDFMNHQEEPYSRTHWTGPRNGSWGMGTTSGCTALRGISASSGWASNYRCDGDTGIGAAMERGEVQYLACTSDCNRATLDAVYLTEPNIVPNERTILRQYSDLPVSV